MAAARARCRRDAVSVAEEDGGGCAWRGKWQNERAARRRPSEKRRAQRSSPSRPVEAATVGSTGTRTPDKIHARWLGAKRGAKSPSLISRVTAKRLNTVGGKKRRVLSAKPSVGVSMSP